MSATEAPTRQRIPKVVIAGFGFAGLAAHKSLAASARRGQIRLQVVTMDPYFAYTPLLHRYVAGKASKESTFVPLTSLINTNHVELEFDTITSLNLQDKVLLGEKNKYMYDYLIIAFGSQTDYFDIPGAKENSLAYKSRINAQTIKNTLYNDLERAQPKINSIVVVGTNHDATSITAGIKKLLASRNRIQTTVSNVDVQLVEKVGSLYLKMLGGEEIPSDLTIWAAGAKSSEMPIITATSTIALSQVQLNENFELADFPEVVIAGEALLSTEIQLDIPTIKLQGRFAAHQILDKLSLKSSRKVTDWAPSTSWNHALVICLDWLKSLFSWSKT